MRYFKWKIPFLVSFLLSFTHVQSNCGSDGFKKNCSEMLGSYVFIKSFDINHTKSGQTSEYSYVFCKGTNYILTVCDANSDSKKMIIELYDKNHKLVASNFNKKTNKTYTKMGYPCQSTGVYYMKYKFPDGVTSCGISQIGFKKS